MIPPAKRILAAVYAATEMAHPEQVDEARRVARRVLDLVCDELDDEPRFIAVLALFMVLAWTVKTSASAGGPAGEGRGA